MVKRLQPDEAVAVLPTVVLELLRGRLRSRLSRVGSEQVAILSGRKFQMILHVEDWNLLMDNILYDPETMADGENDPSSPPAPNLVRPYRSGAYLRPTAPTAVQRRFNPRIPVGSNHKSQVMITENSNMHFLKGIFCWVLKGW